MPAANRTYGVARIALPLAALKLDPSVVFTKEIPCRAYSIAACGIETAHTSEVYDEMLNVARIALPLAALKLRRW